MLINNRNNEIKLLCLSTFLKKNNLKDSDIPNLILRVDTYYGDRLAKLRDPQRTDGALIADIYSTEDPNFFDNNHIALIQVIGRNYPCIFLPRVK